MGVLTLRLLTRPVKASARKSWLLRLAPHHLHLPRLLLLELCLRLRLHEALLVAEAGRVGPRTLVAGVRVWRGDERVGRVWKVVERRPAHLWAWEMRVGRRRRLRGERVRLAVTAANLRRRARREVSGQERHARERGRRRAR